ncbi:uncharacterized protein HKW66_Vig0141450 [Vigna angularis]|uniref:Uncharacterized protein n=1 Tax=Phaseolus angularis TaxID=3914 RepID=A0A8T0KEI5_PHAAN|nr:uncharacterized protein HKW66_Vig0141450 [Vigna angularis]
MLTTSDPAAGKIIHFANSHVIPRNKLRIWREKQFTMSILTDKVNPSHIITRLISSIAIQENNNRQMIADNTNSLQNRKGRFSHQKMETMEREKEIPGANLYLSFVEEQGCGKGSRVRLRVILTSYIVRALHSFVYLINLVLLPPFHISLCFINPFDSHFITGDILDLPGFKNEDIGFLWIEKAGQHNREEKNKMQEKLLSSSLSLFNLPISPSSPSSPSSPLPHSPFSLSSSGLGMLEVGAAVRSIGTPSRSPGSASLYLAPGLVSPPRGPNGVDSVVSSPWSNRRASSASKITSEEKLEKFLAEVDERINESAGKMSTPPPTVPGFGIVSPNTVTGSSNTSGTTRLMPLRPVRMSPGSQKFNTPPKKGEGEFPSPMSMEESVQAFEHLGIYPQIEQWHDQLRQWFSSVLLNPLLNKIETSHIQVMQAAAKLGISITISPVGNDMLSTSATLPTIDKSQDWQSTMSLNEDGLLHQLHSTLVLAIDSSKSKSFVSNILQSAQQASLVPMMQECVDAITEHQRLQALVKGEWVKGLLPQSSVRADYTVQRIRELAEGTCLKNYEYLGSGEVYDKKNKKWTLELPSDSHLLLYLFCAFLEHPKWMLHVDALSYAGAQSSKNPLFLGVLPPKERFPEKYIAVVSTVPSVLHPGACILAVGKQGPPIFALYWDKKLQFSLQGRTALWDSILLLCHKIKVGYGGIIRGMHLGASALSILPVMEAESED